ncbi:MAG: hypothetical protein E3K32_03460 [wastewater metagenome]|nr:hypothetical protein [Candidatus Loosdrechtia aerotolerans]
MGKDELQRGTTAAAHCCSTKRLLRHGRSGTSPYNKKSPKVSFNVQEFQNTGDYRYICRILIFDYKR